MQISRLSAPDCCRCSPADLDSECGDRAVSRFPSTSTNTTPLVPEGESGCGVDDEFFLHPVSAGEFDLEGRSFLLSVFEGREFDLEEGSLLTSEGGFSLDGGFCSDDGSFLLPAFEKGGACSEGNSALPFVSEEAREFGFGGREGSFLISFEGEEEISVECRSASFLFSVCVGCTRDGLYKTRSELSHKHIYQRPTHLVIKPAHRVRTGPSKPKEATTPRGILVMEIEASGGILVAFTS